MLRHEGDLLLDDVPLCELEDKLGLPVRVVGSEGADLLEALFGTNDF
jgi:NifB/MoaA-like Fe-S oxidoreductase